MTSNNRKPELLQGEVFIDHRGQISSLNHFRFDGVKRVYFIHHGDTNFVRGWHGHQFERKWFYCVKGAFTLALVQPNDWNNPSPDLEAQIFDLSADNSQIVCVPAGYASSIRAKVTGSALMVLSDKLLEDALGDSWRYDSTMWTDLATM